MTAAKREYHAAPSRGGRRIWVQFELDIDTHTMIRELARMQERSMADAVRRAVFRVHEFEQSRAERSGNDHGG